jgi:hypothetical protein
MIVYILGMLGLSYWLAWIGGEKIQSTLWVLLIYPLVRYAMYSAIALALVTIMHPVLAFAIVLLVSVGASILAPTSPTGALLDDWLRISLYAPLPSTNLLSEARFLAVTQASLHAIPWTHHLIALTYGLNYAFVCLLIAVWLFRNRSLMRG